MMSGTDNLPPLTYELIEADVGLHGPVAQKLARHIAALASPAAQAQPVAEVRLMKSGGNVGIATHIVALSDELQPGTKLYTAPPLPPEPAAPETLAPDAEVAADMRTAALGIQEARQELADIVAGVLTMQTMHAAAIQFDKLRDIANALAAHPVAGEQKVRDRIMRAMCEANEGGDQWLCAELAARDLAAPPAKATTMAGGNKE